MEDQMATPAPATFAQLLEHAVNEPGILSSAYRQFYGYSLGNQLLALSQCLARGIQPRRGAESRRVAAVHPALIVLTSTFRDRSRT
jgi:hypothetical protein